MPVINLYILYDFIEGVLIICYAFRRKNYNKFQKCIYMKTGSIQIKTNITGKRLMKSMPTFTVTVKLQAALYIYKRT